MLRIRPFLLGIGSVDESSEFDEGQYGFNRCQEIVCQFIVADGNAAELFQLVDQSFDTIPLAVGLGQHRPRVASC